MIITVEIQQAISNLTQEDCLAIAETFLQRLDF